MGIYEETLVIYMGDNGFMFGEHGLIDKRVAYETSIRVPMIMQCPELFEGRGVVEEVVANIDIGPHHGSYRAENPAHMDGQSFISLAQESKLAGEIIPCLLLGEELSSVTDRLSLRGDQYKYHLLWALGYR